MALKGQDPAMADVLIALFDWMLVFEDWPCHIYDEDDNGVRQLLIRV